MIFNKIALLILTVVALVGCADKPEVYVLQNPTAPVSEATLTISGDNANLVVIYLDNSSINLPGSIERNKSSARFFTLTLESFPDSKFEFATTPEVSPRLFVCDKCINMSPIKERNKMTRLIEWKLVSNY